ncbi:hypothetical protein AU210_011452 [Fusarium oxysporum f. sp. radicis-cucumerinum]|uniref:Arginosuccinate synthase C-terminal domain-containing protein n=1 Tax=Fusarium oxysporum f. sp. radicis-cucumerinum TaxID=327505 RepID=A0A2H3GX73_FUSOX|nr:hypothetical protein AU210_011452 [Fusarium oxysporum f. sp. radicis-cucumerinum]
MDSKVRIIRDRLSDDWAQCIYNGMYFTPEREFVQQAISFSQKQVDGKVEALAYKGNVIIVGRSSETSNLYSEEESSMDTLDMDWSVEDTTGFINVNAIRIAKYGERKIRDGEPLSKLHTAICNIIYPYAFCRPTDEIGSPWFRYMVADQACLHCLLAMAATYLNVLRNIPTPSLESIEATRHFSQALRLMNPRLSQPASAQKDSNIAIIISLAIHSNITQNLTASTMHLQGLENLLTFRPGGISDIRECNRALLHKICRTDIELAVAQGTRTRFGNAGLTAAAAGPISARNPPYPLNQMSELLRQVTRELLALCRRPGKAKMSGLQYQDVLISMWQRLGDFAPLSGARPQDLMDDVWQLALLAFLVTVTWSASYLKSVHCKLLHELLREHIKNRALLAKGEEYRPLWLWIVFVYGLSLTNGDCGTLVLDEIREASNLLEIRNWEEARAKVKPFPWIDIVHNVPGRALWEAAVVTVPPQPSTVID